MHTCIHDTAAKCDFSPSACPILLNFGWKSYCYNIYTVYGSMKFQWVWSCTVPPANYFPREYLRIFGNKLAFDMRSETHFLRNLNLQIFPNISKFMVRNHLRIFENVCEYSKIFRNKLAPDMRSETHFLHHLHSQIFPNIREFTMGEYSEMCANMWEITCWRYCIFHSWHVL